MRFLLFALALGATTAAFSACAAPTQTTGSSCPPVPFVLPQLLYPRPGATAVPVDTSSAVVADASGTSGTPGTYQLVTAALTVPLGPLTAPPSPLPSPIATPGPPFYLSFGLALPPLTAATTYTLDFVYVGCPPGTTTDKLGSFTTAH